MMRTMTGSGTARRDSLLVAYVFTVVMVATTLPTPLYAIYSARLALNPLMVTVIYAVYAVGVLGTLQFLGRLSDHVGRRPVLLAAVAFSVASAVVFVATKGLTGLFVGRLVSGVSAGLITGAATAYIAELESPLGVRSKAGVMATVANMGGLGLGPLIAGVLADHVPHPLDVPYLAGALLLLPVVLVFVWRVPETVRVRDGFRAGVGFQRIGVPAEIRVPFLAAAIAGLASFALLGFTTALAGQVLAEGLGNRSHQTAGVVAFLLFAAAAAAQVAAGRFVPRTASLLGLVLMTSGVVVVVSAVAAASLPVLVAGVLVGGVGVGLAFRAGLSSVTAIAPEERRGEVISAFFIAAYIGLTIPVVAAGVLVTATTLLDAAIALAVFIGVLAAASAAIIMRAPR
ncbi:putative MFS family arabinose efflux permease [Actinocorallia herbida]|uniref:Putative MFS family arabinose efflux permease n=2 Tax=Actinocorallia herbida TaxID=58109 RepID=A0A3N1D917_9ACTN|nr:putative MFS family arabinose efflux permease [Actinocorallia herbida]